VIKMMVRNFSTWRSPKASRDFGQSKLERPVDWFLAGLDGVILKAQGFASSGGSSLTAHG
jgi:hypothetical protein